MANIAFTGYVVLRREPKGTVELANVAVAKDLRLPKGGLTLLYGFRHALEELSRQTKLAEKDGGQLVPVKVAMELVTVDNSVGWVSVGDLASLQMLHLGRVRPDLYNLIAEKLRTYMGDLTGLGRLDVEDKFARRPDLIGRLHEEPEFAHLSVIVYRIDLGDEKILWAATIFSVPGGITIESIGKGLSVRLPGRVLRTGQLGSTA
jgi:hypothetical protein